MMIPIPSANKRFTIQLLLEAAAGVELGIVCYDPLRTNTDYFRRKLRFTASPEHKGKRIKRAIEIPLPLTPENLAIEIYDKHQLGDDNFSVLKMNITPMKPTTLVGSEEHHRFMEFAIDFAQKAGYLKTGFYPSKDDAFLIQYLPTIADELGEELVTPARISRSMPCVQLSQKLIRGFSIPVRIAILSHEACHFFLNTRSEKQADLCGIKYYLDYGFPKIEAVYAATKVFGMHPDSIGETHLNRTRDIMDFIDSYKLQNTPKQSKAA